MAQRIPATPHVGFTCITHSAALVCPCISVLNWMWAVRSPQSVQWGSSGVGAGEGRLPGLYGIEFPDPAPGVLCKPNGPPDRVAPSFIVPLQP